VGGVGVEKSRDTREAQVLAGETLPKGTGARGVRAVGQWGTEQGKVGTRKPLSNDFAGCERVTSPGKGPRRKLAKIVKGKS